MMDISVYHTILPIVYYVCNLYIDTYIRYSVSYIENAFMHILNCL